MKYYKLFSSASLLLMPLAVFADGFIVVGKDSKVFDEPNAKGYVKKMKRCLFFPAWYLNIMKEPMAGMLWNIFRGFADTCLSRPKPQAVFLPRQVSIASATIQVRKLQLPTAMANGLQLQAMVHIQEFVKIMWLFSMILKRI